MEKMFVLKSISERKERTIQRQDGQTKVLKWYDVVMSNGLDTVMGETSESVTNQIEATDENAKLLMDVGKCYMCRVNLNVVEYEKEGKKSAFLKATFHQIALI